MKTNETSELSTTSSAPARTVWFLLSLLGVSLASNVLFGVTTLRLVGQAHAEAVPKRIGAAVGATLPPIRARRPDGTPAVLSYDKADPRPTLLYVFGSSCYWCARNIENARAVFKAAAPSHRVVLLGVTGQVGDEMKAFGDSVQLLVSPHRSTFEAYALGPTPTTLIISSTGEVLNSWVGAYSGPVGAEVEEHFGVKLPGLVNREESNEGDKQ